MYWNSTIGSFFGVVLFSIAKVWFTWQYHDMQNTFDVKAFDVSRFDDILSRGLCSGVGDRDSQMCIEAAICTVLDLPHGDDPGCVASAVRSFKITLNDKRWSSAKARADGLRDLGLAQLGSKGVVDNGQFAKKVAEGVIRKILPRMIRDRYQTNQVLMRLAYACESEGSQKSALALRDEMYKARAAASIYFRLRHSVSMTCAIVNFGDLAYPCWLLTPAAGVVIARLAAEPRRNSCATN